MKVPLILFVLLAICGTSTSAPAGMSPDPIPGYHDFDALTRALNSAASSHANLANVRSIGKSAEGRDIWVVEIGNRSGVPLSDRPALLIVANLDANQLVGSELSVGIIDYLLENYATDEAVKNQLDNATFYIIPRANPDGAEQMFARVQTGQAGNMRSMDDDNDGRRDEDGADDLNGDGYISVMRVADSMGEYMVDPADDRLLKKADPQKGESGIYKVYIEGLDDDGDGYYNEDPKGGVNLNRNFQHEYPYYTVGAGPHMISEQESRAIMDFVIAHRNIAAIYTFGPHDNLINAPNNKGELSAPKPVQLPGFATKSNEGARKVGTFSPPTRRGFFFRQQQSARTGRPSSGRKPETTVNKDDREYFKRISKKYKEVLGLKQLPETNKPAGAFFEYGYYQFGVPSFSTPGWGPEMANATDSTNTDSTGNESTRERPRGPSGTKDAKAMNSAGRGSDSNGNGSSEKSVDAKLLEWMDANSIDGYLNWTSFDHPTLGDVEIGGFKPYEYLNPPTEIVDELGPKHGAFVVELAAMFSAVQIATTEVVDHGGGVFRVKAEIENSGFLPTSTAHGVVSRSVKPTMVQLDIDPDALLSGAAKTSFFQKIEGSGKRTKFEWIVSGKRGDKVTLRVVSQKGGKDSREIELR